jgi:hypothetical protein
MRTFLFASLAALAAVLVAPRLDAQVSVSASVEVSFDYFHERLTPHGHWVEVDNHGWCWYPNEVTVEWRPYSHGHWIFTDDDGWVWVSDHEWGWACEHYGRWTYVDTRWYWVPGYEWSGAWVVWRNGGGYYGWAVLPPAVEWRAGVGIHTGSFSLEVGIYEPSWVFCRETHILSPRISTVIIDRKQTTTIIRETKVSGTVSIEKGRVRNEAIRVTDVERTTGKKVERKKLEEARTLGAAQVNKEQGDRVKVFRPKVKEEGRGKAPAKIDKKEAERKTLRERETAERDPKGERPDRDPKGDKPEGDKPDREPKGDKPEGDRPEREPKGDKPEREPKGDKPEREPKGDKPEREPKGDKPEREPRRPPKEAGDEPEPPKKEAEKERKPPREDSPKESGKKGDGGGKKGGKDK